MPEGDTLYRIATQLKPVLEGETLLAVDGSRQSGPHRLEIDHDSLVGRTVTSVEARGKHLMISFDDSRVLHSHLGMTGSWHVYPLGQAWNKPEQHAALALRTAKHVVVSFSPKVLRLVTETTLRRDEYLTRLGPDLMIPGVDLAEVLRRLRIHNATPIGEAVMNQTIAAGIGNVYKSETLFIQRMHPWDRVGFFSDEKLLDYLKTAVRLMRRNRGSGKRTTRFAPDAHHVWVYGRRGENCLECGGIIHLRRQGDAGRTTYWCPICQPAIDPENRVNTSDTNPRSKPPIKGCS